MELHKAKNAEIMRGRDGGDKQMDSKSRLLEVEKKSKVRFRSGGNINACLFFSIQIQLNSHSAAICKFGCNMCVCVCASVHAYVCVCSQGLDRVRQCLILTLLSLTTTITQDETR